MPKVSQREDEILVVEYPAHARIGLKDVKSAYEDRMAICHEPHCILSIIHGIALITDEAVEFLMSSEHTEMIKANAIVVDPESGYYEHGNNILWILKNIDKPKVNVEVFDNEESALEWLSKYL